MLSRIYNRPVGHRNERRVGSVPFNHTKLFLYDY